LCGVEDRSVSAFVVFVFFVVGIVWRDWRATAESVIA